MRQEQSCEISQEGGGKEDEPPGTEQSQTHDGVAYQDKQEGLNQRHPCHEDDLRPDVTTVGELEEFFALQQGAVLDDLLGATAHTDESGHDDGHEEIAHQILVVHDGITIWWRIAGEQGTDDGQDRGLQECDAEILYVGDLRLEVTTQEDQELTYLAWLLQVGGRHIRDGGLCKRRLVLQIELVPLLRCHLTGIRGLTHIVDGLLVDDVQHNLRIDIAAGGTSARLSIGIVGSPLEIGNGIDGIAVEDRIATFVQQPQTVEELIDIAGGLVDIHHHQLALVGLLLQQVDDLLCIC